MPPKNRNSLRAMASEATPLSNSSRMAALLITQVIIIADNINITFKQDLIQCCNYFQNIFTVYSLTSSYVILLPN